MVHITPNNSITTSCCIFEEKGGIAINGLLIANRLSPERDSEVIRNARQNDEQ